MDLHRKKKLKFMDRNKSDACMAQTPYFVLWVVGYVTYLKTDSKYQIIVGFFFFFFFSLSVPFTKLHLSATQIMREEVPLWLQKLNFYFTNYNIWGRKTWTYNSSCLMGIYSYKN